MRRREFITMVGGAAVACWPLAARAQQPRLVGVLMNGNSNEPPMLANVKAFTEGLRDHGWIDGKNLRLEVRWNGSNAASARLFASDLIGLSPALTVSTSRTKPLPLPKPTTPLP